MLNTRTGATLHRETDFLTADSSIKVSEKPILNRYESAVIKLSGVSKKFGQLQALNEISLGVGKGEIYGLLGPNGAGKSTTINIICGLLAPDSGSVTVNEFDLATQTREAKRVVGIVPQELALYIELNAQQNLRFFGCLYGLSGAKLDARIDHLLEMVDLSDRAKDPVSSFSGGMQRRLNIAAGLVHSPSVILMDEPTVGLDPQNRNNILDIVQAIAAAGAAVLYSTHYMDEVERICDRIGIIDHGTLLVEGTLEELRREAGGKQILTLRGSFVTDKIENVLALHTGEQIVKCSGEEIVLDLANAESRLSEILTSVAQAGDVREVFMNRQSLESLFIQLTGRELRE